jgi:hypothetical protein
MNYAESALPQAGTASALELVRERGNPPASTEGLPTMIKPNQTTSANVNVLDEAKLEQVVGGHGHCGGGYRWKKYSHRYENRRSDCSNYDGGYEGKGYCEDSYDSSDCYEEKSDYCDRRYS